MKTLKISLVIIVLAAIGVGIYLSVQKSINPEEIEIDESELSRKDIEQQIKQLEAKPDDRFCKDFYDEVAYKINDYYKPAPPKHLFGRFGKTQSENDDWKVIFENNLYATYADKFIKQAKAVLNGSQWNPADLNFIQAENNNLKNSELSEPGNPRNNEFETIQAALNKYNEIVVFISTCRNFSYPNTDLMDEFPLNEVQSKIQRAESLRNNRLENNYVNNCSRLHNELIATPQILFNAHIKYLDEKISDKSEWYLSCKSQREYANLIYQPLKSKIDALVFDIYKVSNFNSEKNRLTKKLNDNSSEATRHFQNKN